METMNKDEFAKFLFETNLKVVRMYNFDMMYDISNIIKNIQVNHTNYNTPLLYECIMFFRENGVDICKKDDTLYNQYLMGANEAYNIEICINHSYLINIPFAKVTQIK